MDADHRIIPIVDDDQGEGFMDILDKYDIEKISELNKRLEKERMKSDQKKHSRRFQGK